MNEELRDPFRDNWTTDATGSGATPVELAQALGAWEVSELEAMRSDVAAALAELASTVGPLPLCGDGDPVVVLLRSLNVLCRNQPDATSLAAAQLIAELGGRSGNAVDLTVDSTKAPAPLRRPSGLRRSWLRTGPDRRRPTLV